MIKFFDIEKDGPRPRQDIAKYSDVKEEFAYAIDSMFEKENYSKSVSYTHLDVYKRQEKYHNQKPSLLKKRSMKWEM